MIRAEQPSFAGGEIAPELAARIDTAKHQTALRLGRNVIGLRQGGVRSRPGTLLVGQVRNNGRRVRLIPFQFSARQAYCLEFGHLIFRVIVDEGRGPAYVTEGPKAISGVPSTAPLQLTVNGHGFSAGQQIYIPDEPPAYPGVVGLVDADGLSGVNTRTFRVAEVIGENIIELQALGQSGDDRVDASAWSAYASGGFAARLFEMATPYNNSTGVEELDDIAFEQSADVMYLAHPSHPLMRLIRTGHAAWTLTDVRFGTDVLAPTSSEAEAAPPPYPAASGDTVNRYRVTALSDITGQESLPSGVASATNDITLDGAANRIFWVASASPEVTRYVVYKESNGLYGYIGATEALEFYDNNIDPDLGDTPPINGDPLGEPGSYPGAIGFFEQRLFLAGPDAKPNGIWGSRSGDFENLNFSRPVKADDSVAFGVSARQVNRVLHLVPMSDLLAFTSDSVFRINGGGVTDYITPTSIVVRPQVHRGASRARPVVIDDAVLYVTAKGSKVRNLGYQLQADGYQGADLTVFASHFFEGRTIEEMAWCEHPHSAVFCRTSDAKLLCLTWMLEQEVWGWTLLETDGEVESVCAVTETDPDTRLSRDSVYIAVRRPATSGPPPRLVERVAEPFETGDDIAGCVCLDSAVTYAGEPNDLFAGLEHLEGRAVKALADGHVVSGLTVTNGRVTLPFEAARVTVGLPYSAVIKTLTPVNPQAATQGRKLGVSRATLRLLNSRGVKAGMLMDRLETIKPRLDAGWGEPADLLSGDHALAFDTDYSPDAGVIVRQDEPLPMTVLGVYVEASVGG